MEAVEGRLCFLDVLDVPGVMRCVLLCMLGLYGVECGLSFGVIDAGVSLQSTTLKSFNSAHRNSVDSARYLRLGCLPS